MLRFSIFLVALKLQKNLVCQISRISGLDFRQINPLAKKCNRTCFAKFIFHFPRVKLFSRCPLLNVFTFYSSNLNDLSFPYFCSFSCMKILFVYTFPRLIIFFYRAFYSKSWRIFSSLSFFFFSKLWVLLIFQKKTRILYLNDFWMWKEKFKKKQGNKIMERERKKKHSYFSIWNRENFISL